MHNPYSNSNKCLKSKNTHTHDDDDGSKPNNIHGAHKYAATLKTAIIITVRTPSD